MATNHGPSIKDDEQYEKLRDHGMSKSKAAAIANTEDASEKGGQSPSSANPASKARNARAARACGDRRL